MEEIIVVVELDVNFCRETVWFACVERELRRGGGKVDAGWRELAPRIWAARHLIFLLLRCRLAVNPRNMPISKPLDLYGQGVGFIVTIHLKCHTVVRGLLIQLDDNMNSYLKNVSVTEPNLATRSVDEFYIRGSQICYIMLPDMLRYSPLLNSSKA